MPRLVGAAVTVVVCSWAAWFSGCSGGTTSVGTKRAEIHEKVDVWGLAFSPDDDRIAVSSPNDESVRLWSWQGTPRVLQTLHQDTGVGGVPNGLRFSQDGELLVSEHSPTADDKIMKVWRAKDGTPVVDIGEFMPGGHTHAGLALSPDGSILIRTQLGGWLRHGDSKVLVDSFIVYRTQTGERLWGLATDPIELEGVAISPDGRYAAATGQGAVKENGKFQWLCKLLVIGLNEKRVLITADILSAQCQVPFVVWSPDGRRIVVGGGGGAFPGTTPPGVEILDAATGKRLASFAAISNMVGLDYSGDGRHLVVAWGNVGVEIWDANHTKLLGRMSGQPAAARFSADGRYLAVADTGVVTIWEMK